MGLLSLFSLDRLLFFLLGAFASALATAVLLSERALRGLPPAPPAAGRASETVLLAHGTAAAAAADNDDHVPPTAALPAQIREALDRVAWELPLIGTPLDMDAVDTARLAAAPPSSLPPLASSAPRVGQESSVWFSALCGRLWRDMAASDRYRAWVRAKLQGVLNKGVLPPMIDPLVVGDIRMEAASPPLLSHMRWVPTCKVAGADLGSDVVVDAQVDFVGGLAFDIDTKVWLNSSLSVPVVVTLELSSLSGEVRFGVTKHRSFLSFLEEPRLDFAVSSSVGASVKLRSVHRLDAFIVGRIQKAVRKSLLYPRAKSFRLLWPRAWWPEGGDLAASPRRHAGPEPKPEPKPLQHDEADEANGADDRPNSASTFDKFKTRLFRATTARRDDPDRAAGGIVDDHEDPDRAAGGVEAGAASSSDSDSEDDTVPPPVAVVRPVPRRPLGGLPPPEGAVRRPRAVQPRSASCEPARRRRSATPRAGALDDTTIVAPGLVLPQEWWVGVARKRRARDEAAGAALSRRGSSGKRLGDQARGLLARFRNSLVSAQQDVRGPRRGAR